MKRSWFKPACMIAAAASQVLALGFMAGQREWIRVHGRTIYLRTAPIDPRDAMRGDYVRLNYEMSRVPQAYWRDGLAQAGATNANRKTDRSVYASLVAAADGLAQLVSLSDQKPSQGLFLRGRLENSIGSSTLQIRYGLEAYFLEQGRAGQLEQDRRRDGIQIPLEMEVAVGAGGVGVIRGHRYSPLGIGLDLTNRPAAQTNRFRETRVMAATVRLLNASTQDWAIVDLPGARSLALIVDETWQPAPVVWSHAGDPMPKPEPAHVITLKPGQIHTMRVDFSDPYWAVVPTDQPPVKTPRAQAIGELEAWSARFRLVYRSPEEGMFQDPPNGARLWRGQLPTRAFSPVGRVD